MVDYWAWHGKTLAEHEALSAKYLVLNYRFVSLCVYGGPDQLYAAVVVLQENPVEQRPYPALDLIELSLLIEAMRDQGYGLAFISANWTFSGTVFAVVFEPQDPLPWVALSLVSGPATDVFRSDPDTSTMQGMNYLAAKSGYILRCVSSYGVAGSAYAAIWVPNDDNTLWNNDGVFEDGTQQYARMKAEEAAWCRPAFITLGPDGYYSSLFVANEIGPYHPFTGLTADEYQNAFDQQKSLGYYPVCVQAAGIDGPGSAFAAIFATSTEVVSRKFTATGPAGYFAIDDIVSQAMDQYPQVRHAALALVRGVKLVYARGYTLAEPDWPLVYPTTCFRLASGSKLVTALAVFKLIELGLVNLNESIQDILKLKTPGGGSPPDSRFGEITVQHLLEHTSGLQTDSFDDGPLVVQAFEAAQRPAALPVTEAMTDSFIASLDLVTDPGSAQAYSNCGYYLLGRIVASKWGVASPIDAYQEIIAQPLGLTHLRASTDLLAVQPEDEARYQASYDDGLGWLSDLRTATSQMTPEQPVVQTGYGDDHLSLAQGCGGLSAAAADLARLPAILIDPADNPVLQRSTITTMLEHASIVFSLQSAIGTPSARAGYGFDVVKAGPGNLSFYGQKGGEIGDAGAVVQFSGNTGFVALFGCTVANRGNEIYPDWPNVLAEANKISWGNVDLFPCFGMRSLAVPVASAADATGVYLVDSYGALTQFSGDGTGTWTGQRITDPWFAPLGAVVAAGPEPGNVLLVGSEGYLGLLSQAAGGTPNLPLPISLSASAPPGASVAVVPVAGVPGRTDALFIGLDGYLQVSSVVGGGNWSAPQPVGDQAFAPPGAAVAACQHPGMPARTVAFVVNNVGQLCVSVNDGGQWSAATPISGQNFAPPGAGVAASPEYGNGNQVDVFVVGRENQTGYLYVFFDLGDGIWQGPSSISNQPLTPGSAVVAAPHAGAADRTDVFAVDGEGSLWNFTVTAGVYGTSAMGTGRGFAPPGASVAVTQPPGTADQGFVFVVSSEGVLCEFLSTGTGAWSDPPAYLGPVF